MMDIAHISRYGITAAVLLSVAAAALLLYTELNRPIEEIRIEGQLSDQERELLQVALDPHGDANILSVRLDDVVADVTALGWPQNVSVRRQWPDTLILRINKQGVIALWNDDRYLTNNGRVIDQADVPNTLPSIAAEAVAPEAALAVLQQLDEVARLHGLRIAQLNHSVAQGWWLLQDDGVRINLGRGHPRSQLVDRYQRFLRVRAQLPVEQLATLEYADVRYANGVALKSIDAADEPLLVGHAESTRTVIDER